VIPTKLIAEQKFAEFNALIFQGKLPQIPIYMSNAKGFLGKFVFRRKRSWLMGERISDMHLRINTRYDMSERELEDTIIHEMIHYYIAYNNIKDTSAHGRVFRQMMVEINEQYGREITISHRKSDEPLVDTAQNRKKWHVVAVVDFNDGRRGVKVLPKVAQSIAWYKQNVERAPGVKEVKLVWSLDVMFNKFPVSKSLKVHIVDRQALEEALKESVALKKL
jgi:hypothetical protein